MSRILPQAIAPHGFTLTMILATLALLASSASSQVAPTAKGDQNNPWIVKIKFANASSCTITSVTEETTSCVNNPQTDFCVSRNKFIQWESDPANIRYHIYFNPIQGNPLPSPATGVLMRPIKHDMPFSLYKYSILRDNCNPDTDTFDPHIRVDN